MRKYNAEEKSKRKVWKTSLKRHGNEMIMRQPPPALVPRSPHEASLRSRARKRRPRRSQVSRFKKKKNKKKQKKQKRGAPLREDAIAIQELNKACRHFFHFSPFFLHWPVICLLCVIRWLTGSDSGLTSGPTSPNSLTSGISSGNEKVRLPHLDRSSCLELTISSFDIAYIVIFLMALHRRPEFNADLASGSADDHIALSIVHLVSRKLRLMLIVVLQPINYCMAFIFPFPKIAMRHNRCS